MNTQQAESFIASPFLEDFRIIANEIIKDDDILWVGNVAQFKNITGIDRYPFGYFVITREKIIRVLFDAENEDNGVGEFIGSMVLMALLPVVIVFGLIASLFSGKNEDPTFGKIREFDKNKKHQEISVLNHDHKGHSHGSYLKAAPTKALSNRESSSRVVRVFPTTNLTNIDRFESQDDHTGEKIVEFDIRFVPDETMQVVFYKEQDARNVYDLLLTRLQGNAKSIQQISAISEQLEKLAELHKAQVINDVEFEAAKKRLLEK